MQVLRWRVETAARKDSTTRKTEAEIKLHFTQGQLLLDGSQHEIKERRYSSSIRIHTFKEPLRGPRLLRRISPHNMFTHLNQQLCDSVLLS
ncbi:hypothetical protein TNCV_2666181 [Trichonephila clavipes]|nr:hypothetical protein TNCV_2666181 [Trichonephila clavipes]